MKRGKQIITIMAGMISAFILTACGSSDPLAGTWERVDYKINESEQNIDYSVTDITFADGRVTWGDETYLYELSKDEENIVYFSVNDAQKTYSYDVQDNSLLFEGDLYYKVDTEEYKQYYEEIQSQAQAELDELIAQIEEAEALEKAKEEALNHAVELWDESIAELMNSLDNTVSEKQEEFKQDAISILEGTWEYDHPSRTDYLTFANGTFTKVEDQKVEIWEDDTYEGNVETELTPYFDFKEFSDIRETINEGEAASNLEILKDVPFDEDWELEDLQNADSYIEEKVDSINEQIEDLKSMTFQDFMKGNIQSTLFVILRSGSTEIGRIDAATITEQKLIMRAHSSDYEYYKQ